MNESKIVWEIYVPTMRNNGKPIKTRFHRVWDEKVRAISGGLTILSPSKGQWISDAGKLYKDRMIPVRIIATRSEMEKIVKITLKHYEDEEAVLAYKISEEYILMRRG